MNARILFSPAVRKLGIARSPAMWAAAICFVALLGPLSLPAAAEEKFVNSNEVVIRAGKGPVYDAVTTVHRGEKVNVLEKQGKWLRVSANGKEGWVFESALTSRSLSSGDTLAAGGNASAGTIGLGAAGSGFNQNLGPGGELALTGQGWDAARYASQNNLNLADLQKLKSARAAVTAQAWQKFAAEGNVGPR